MTGQLPTVLDSSFSNLHLIVLLAASAIVNDRKKCSLFEPIVSFYWKALLLLLSISEKGETPTSDAHLLSIGVP